MPISPNLFHTHDATYARRGCQSSYTSGLSAVAERSDLKNSVCSLSNGGHASVASRTMPVMPRTAHHGIRYLKWKADAFDRKSTPAHLQIRRGILSHYSHPPIHLPTNEPDLDRWSPRSLARVLLASPLPSRPKLPRDLAVETKPAMV